MTGYIVTSPHFRDHRGGHDHPDESALTVGCSACIARVQYDQERAALADAPTRRCTWTFNYYPDNGDHREMSFTLDVPVVAGWGGDRVDEYYMGETGEQIGRLCPGDWSNAVDFGSIECTVGPIVATPKAAASLDQPDLFGGAA